MMCDKSKKILDYSIEFLDKYIPEWFETGNKGPLFLFVSGPQGSGKSYVSIQIYNHLMETYGGEKSISFASIDDFYMTHEDQLKLNKQFSNNKLLQGRGLPGTHDMSLLQEVLNIIINHDQHPDQKTVTLPKYDKSQFNGEGDRCPTGQKIKLPVDIFILEGWFLGFNPVLQGIDNTNLLTGDMVDVNAKLFMYSDLLWRNPEIKSLGIVSVSYTHLDVYKRQPYNNSNRSTNALAFAIAPGSTHHNITSQPKQQSWLVKCWTAKHVLSNSEPISLPKSNLSRVTCPASRPIWPLSK